ncbi:E7 protein [Tree shrew papillomavirus 1]|uniref:Protein E7 n=1 Tax=Tree shrew papillomavirus 1 TaxID=2562515 RepID=A0AAF1D2G6_9PAPI|nr:E7 protein [Tree shrew papillomavirus 1]
MCCTMIGKKPDLALLVLGQQDALPENISLYCDESIEDEVEGEVEVDEQVQQARLYKIDIPCPTCDTLLEIIVDCTDDSLREFQQQLLDDLVFLCPDCPTV